MPYESIIIFILQCGEAHETGVVAKCHKQGRLADRLFGMPCYASNSEKGNPPLRIRTIHLLRG
jgi:hypothetical protein